MGYKKNPNRCKISVETTTDFKDDVKLYAFLKRMTMQDYILGLIKNDMNRDEETKEKKKTDAARVRRRKPKDIQEEVTEAAAAGE